jgi:ABC-type glycerol-3-phosphate transport system substrate-binding protein
MKPEGSFNSDLGMMPFPAANYKGKVQEPIYIVWSCPLGISSRCKNPKIAFDFIAYIHSKEVQEKCSRQNTPVNRLVLETSFKKNYPAQYSFIEIASKYKTNMVPEMPQFGEIDNILQLAMNAALLGSKSPKEALDWGQSEIAKVLK